MRFAVYAPLALSLLLALPGTAVRLGALADRIDPRVVLRVLSAAMVGLACASTVTLTLLAVGGVARAWAGPGVLVGHHADPGGEPMGALAGLLLVVALQRAASVAVTGARRRRQVRRVVDAGAEAGGDVVLVDDHAVYAAATPGTRGARGRVIASSGLWAALDPQERAVVVAHEHAHLEGHHHRYLGWARTAVAVNPLLTRLERVLAYTLERCADEHAAREVGDRAVTARAIGRAALAAHRHPPSTRGLARTAGVDPALALGATTGPVPRRVAALLAPAGRPAGVSPAVGRVLSLVTAVALVLVVGAATAAVLHAAMDLGDVHGFRPRP